MHEDKKFTKPNVYILYGIMTEKKEVKIDKCDYEIVNKSNMRSVEEIICNNKICSRQFTQSMSKII